nr:hypothetical protein [uncultured Mediterranean phage uvMED]
MATITEEYKVGTGTTRTFTTQYINESDIKVRVNGGSPLVFTTGTPTTGQYNIASNATTITFGDSYSGTDVLHIYSETDVSSPTVSFTPGSSIKAADLNSLETLVRHGIKENRNQIIDQDIRPGVVTSSHIKDGTLVDADISGSAAIAQTKIATGTLPSGIQVNSANIVDGSIVDGDIATGTLDGRYYTETELDAGQLDNRYFTETELSSGGVIDSRYYTETELDAGQLDTRYYTETELDAGQLDNRYYTEPQLDGGSLDTRYYTETELDAGQLDNRYYTETELDAGQLDNRYYTETELLGGALDGRYFTEAEAEAAFLRQDSSETIASGVTWSNSDAKVATTAAINARIIDLVDDIGGFTVIANETSFPNINPQGSTGQAAIMSIGALTQSYTPSGTTVTIANGTVGNSTVTITGVPSVLPIGFGILVESTSTLNTYTFHRLVPKATEVTTVAGNITNINNCGNNLADIENFADLYQISTSAPTTRADGTALTVGDLWFDSSSNQVMMVYDGSSGDGFSPITPDQATITAINSVSGHVTFQEDLGLITNAVNTGSGNNSINTVGANIAAVNTVAADLNEATSEIDTVANSITNVDIVGNAIANVNATGTNISNVNAVANNETNINAVKNNATNINAAVANATNINTVSASIADVNRYAAEYLIQSGAPSSPSAGDLWYNSTSNTLNYYTGGTWVGISPGIAGLINDANPALANHMDCNNKNLTEVGTVSGDNLQIDFGTL